MTTTRQRKPSRNVVPTSKATPHALHAGRWREHIRMMDIVYTALTAGLLALTWGLVRLCDRVT